MVKVRSERRLAAIMATDVVGYSRLVEQDEETTLNAIGELRSSIVAPLVDEHHGRIIKLMGDGALAEFGSVVDAVSCAIAIQAGLATKQERVVGGVMVSGTVYDQLRGKHSLPLEFAGDQKVKNIARPIRVYRIAPPDRFRPPTAKQGRRREWFLATVLITLSVGTAAWTLWPARPLIGKPVLAVLPFDNLGRDESTERLSDGITEDLITDLAQYRASTSSLAIQGSCSKASR